ncbi:hypothetical protein FDX14_04370 [Citrobacter sp. wls710]|uniref:hypothetical protein n=1 Tax=Citrobacter sp. wls710 TaxID=2576426 RepID=UPI0005A986FC|nr:hypothetical protein [Citrobacter sp. wls710]TKU76288.1 hypothetical protein FDX14_04370 [Citrobacter sp. wls710]
MLDSLPDGGIALFGLQKQMPQNRPSASRSVCSRQARRAQSVLNVHEEHFPGTKWQVSQAETKRKKKSQQKLAKVILEAM